MVTGSQINKLRQSNGSYGNSTSKRITGEDIEILRNPLKVAEIQRQINEEKETKRSRALSDNLSTGSPARQSLNIQTATNRMKTANPSKVTADKQRDYTAITKNRDFIDKSKSAGEKGSFLYKTFNDTVFDLGQFKDDNINKIDYIRNSTDYNIWERMDPVQQALGDRDTIMAIKNMSESDTGIYNYLFNTEGKKSADEYLDNYIKQFNLNRTLEQGNKAAEFARQHPVLGSIGSSIATVAKPEGLLYTLGQNLKGQEVDPNSSYFTGSNIQNTIRGTVSEDMSKTGKFLYDTGMSVLDSLAASTGGPTAGALMLASGAGSDAAKSVKERGGSDRQAALSALASGAAEAVFERISPGNLKSLKEIPIKGIKDIVRNTIKSTGVNASEEAFTELSNVITDYFIMGDLSDFTMAKNNYLSQGFTEAEADRMTIKDMAKRIGLSAAAGALSGGAMSEVGQLSNYVGGSIEGNKVNKQGMIDTYVADGMNMQQEYPELFNLALEIEKNKQEQKKVSNYQIGKLARGVDYIKSRSRQQDLVGQNIEAEQTPNTSGNAPYKQASMENETTENFTPEAQNGLKTENTSSDVKSVKNANATWRNIEGATIKGVSSVENGNVKLEIESDGVTVKDSIDNVTFEDDSVQQVYAEASRYQTNGAKAFTTNYDENVSIPDYQKAFDAYYDAGIVDMPMDKVNSAYASFIPESTRIAAYYSGINDAKGIATGPKAATGIGGVVRTEASEKMDADTRNGLDTLGKLIGVDIVIEETLAGGRANGAYQKGKVYIALDSENPYMSVAKHELTHAIQEFSPDKYKVYKDFVVREINKTNPLAYNEMVDKLISRYAEMSQDITRSEAMDEVVADASEMFLTDPEVIRKLTQQDKNIAEKIIDIIRNLIKNIQNAISTLEPKSKAARTLNENLEVAKEAEKLWLEAIDEIAKSNQSKDSDIKYSLKESFSDQIQRWLSGNMEHYESFYLGNTPSVYTENNEIQAKNLPMVLDQNTMYKMTGGKHGIAIDDIENIPEKLKDPLIIFKGSVDNSLAIIIDMQDKQDNTVLVAMHLDRSRDRIRVNRIPSAYGKDNISAYIGEQIKNGNFLWWNKERSLAWITRAGLQLPDLVQSISNASQNSVSQTDENIKHSIGEYSKLDDDIRYQLKDIDYADYYKLYQENRKLREINTLLNEQFKVTNELKPDKKQLTRVVNEIIKKAQSSYDVNSVVENLETIWQYVHNHSESMYTDEAIDAVQSMAKMILKKSQATDNTLVIQSKDMLDEIKKTPLVLSQKDRADLSSEGGFNNFRRKYIGKIKLVASGGIEVDTFYEGLSEKYPEFFGDEITHPADQLIKIAEVIDFIKPINYNPYGMSIDESSRDLAYEIISSAYLDIRQAPATFADKKKVELDRLRVRYNQNVRELREEYKNKYNERLALIKKQNEEKIGEIVEKAKEATADQKEAYRQQVQKLRDQNLQKLKAQQQRFSERMDNARERRNRTVEANKWKTQIKKVAKDLSDMLLKPSEKSHLPKGFTQAIKEVLQILDFESGTLGPNGEPTQAAFKWMKLQQAYSALKNSDDDIVNSLYFENVEADLQDLTVIIENRRVNQLNHEELKAVHDIMKHIKHLVGLENKAFAENMRENIATIGDSVIHHLAIEGEFTQSSMTANNKGVNTFVNMLTKGNIKPYYFFKRIGGEFEKLYKNVRDGEDRFVENFENGNQFAHEMFQKHDYFSWAGDKPTEFTTVRGQKVSLTTEQKLYIYAAYRRKQGKQHILKGGIVVEDPKIETEGKGRDKVIKKVTYQSDPVPFTEIDMERLEESLTVEQKAFVSDMVDYLSHDLSKLGNEVANKLFGLDAYMEENYIPLTSDRSFLFTKAGVTDDKRIKKMSFTKPTVRNASNPIIAAGFMEVWSKHLVDMSMYNALVLPLEDFQKVWNYRRTDKKTGQMYSVKNAIKKAYGPEANKYIEKLIIDINGGIKQDVGGELSNLLLSKMKVDAVMGNLSVAIQQPSSLARAFVIIDPKYFVKTAFTRRDYEELLKYSPQAKLKQYGYFDVNMGRSLLDVVTEKEYDTPIERIKAFFTDKNVRNEVFSWLPQKMDELTWSYIWNTVKVETKDTTNLQEGTEDYWKHVKERFKEVIDRSQVMDSVFQRSELMRSQNPFARVSTNFMAEPTVSYNMLYDAISQYKKDGKGAAPYVSRSVAAVISAMVLNSLLKSIITAGRDKDEEKTYGEKYLDSFAKNLLDDPAGMVPYVNSIVSTFKGYDPVRPDMQLFQNLYYAWTKLDSNKYTTQQKIQQLAQSIAPFFNVPLKNISRDIEMVWRNGKGLLENIGILQGLSEYEKLQNKYPDVDSSAATGQYYDMLYNAKVSGDNDLYRQIYSDLIKSGKKPSNIDEAMRDRKREGLIIRKKEEEFTNPALTEMYEAFNKNDAKAYQSARKKLIDEGYSTDDIQWGVNLLKSENLKENAPTVEEFIAAYKTGKESVWKPLYDKMRAAGWSQKDLLALIK